MNFGLTTFLLFSNVHIVECSSYLLCVRWGLIVVGMSRQIKPRGRSVFDTLLLELSPGFALPSVSQRQLARQHDVVNAQINVVGMIRRASRECLVEKTSVFSA